MPSDGPLRACTALEGMPVPRAHAGHLLRRKWPPTNTTVSNDCDPSLLWGSREGGGHGATWIPLLFGDPRRQGLRGYFLLLDLVLCYVLYRGNAVHAVRTRCKVLDVGKYSDPTFGPF